MNLTDLLQEAAMRQDTLREGASLGSAPYVAGPREEEETAAPSKMALLASLLGSSGPQGGSQVSPLGSTYTGGTGDFNATHEGPGTEGLTFGQAWGNYPMVQRLDKRIEKLFGVNVGSGVIPRDIANTNTPSEHAYGAAIDVMTGVNQQLQDEINAWLTLNRVANKFGYSNILGYWNRPEDHSNHLHVGWLY